MSRCPHMWVLSCCSCCSCRRCCCRLVTSAVDKRLLCTVHPILNVLWPPSQDISLALPPAPPGHQTPTSPRLHCMAHFATPLSCWRYYFCVAQFTALPGPGKQQKTSYTRARRNRWEGGGEADLGRWRKDASIVSIITHVPWCGAADSRLLTLGPVYYLSTTSRTKVGHVRRRRSDRLRGGASKNPVFPYNRESANVFSSKKLSKIHSLWPLQTA